MQAKNHRSITSKNYRVFKQGRVVSATQSGKGNKHTQIPKRSTKVLNNCEIGSMKNGWMNCGF